MYTDFVLIFFNLIPLVQAGGVQKSVFCFFFLGIFSFYPNERSEEKLLKESHSGLCACWWRSYSWAKNQINLYLNDPFQSRLSLILKGNEGNDPWRWAAFYAR